MADSEAIRARARVPGDTCPRREMTRLGWAVGYCALEAQVSSNPFPFFPFLFLFSFLLLFY
jgi:hypothetical protein